MSAALKSLGQAGTKALNAAAGAVGVAANAAKLGVKAGEVGVQLASTAVNVAGKAGAAVGVAANAALDVAQNAAVAAAGVTASATKAAAAVAEGALVAGGNISEAALKTSAQAAKGALETTGTAAATVLQTTNNVIGVIGGLVNTPLAGLSNYFKNNNIKKEQLKGPRGKDLLITTLVAYYSEKQRTILSDITGLSNSRLDLVRELRTLFSTEHCKRGWISNKCDEVYDKNTEAFTAVERSIKTKLIVINSHLKAFEGPLKAQLNAELADDSIQIDNPDDMEKINAIFTKITSPHSAEIAGFFTVMNKLCDKATEIFGSSEEETSTISATAVTAGNNTVIQEVKEETNAAVASNAVGPSASSVTSALSSALKSVNVNVGSAVQSLNLGATSTNLNAGNRTYPPVPSGPIQPNRAAILEEQGGGRRRTKRRSARSSRRLLRFRSLRFGRRKRLTSRRGSKAKKTRTRRA